MNVHNGSEHIRHGILTVVTSFHITSNKHMIETQHPTAVSSCDMNTPTNLLREEPGAVSAAVDGVIAVRGSVSEVELDPLFVDAAEQLVLAVLRHRQLLQAHNLKENSNKKESKEHRGRGWESVMDGVGDSTYNWQQLALCQSAENQVVHVATRTCSVLNIHVIDALPPGAWHTTKAFHTLRSQQFQARRNTSQTFRSTSVCAKQQHGSECVLEYLGTI